MVCSHSDFEPSHSVSSLRFRGLENLLAPARGRLKHRLLVSVVAAVLAWKKQDDCFSQIPDSRMMQFETVVPCGMSPGVASQPWIPVKRGITRDYTPFLLILQGMALQLQGIALPPF